jgi:hypothetical protein
VALESVRSLNLFCGQVGFSPRRLLTVVVVVAINSFFGIFGLEKQTKKKKKLCWVSLTWKNDNDTVNDLEGNVRSPPRERERERERRGPGAYVRVCEAEAELKPGWLVATVLGWTAGRPDVRVPRQRAAPGGRQEIKNHLGL